MSYKKTKIKIFGKTDVILIAAFIIFAFMFYFIFDLNTKTGDTAVIKINGEIYGEFALNENKDIDVYLDNNIISNTVRIQNNKVYMLHADCPDKRCIKHKPLDLYSRDIIVCLPNKITVEIKTSDKINKYDSIIKK